MKTLQHFTINTIILTLLGVIMFYYLRTLIVIPMVMISIAWGAFFPDLDLRFKKGWHRLWFSHSITVNLVLWLFSYAYLYLALLTSLMALGVGLHCLSDTHPLNKGKHRGTYCIKFYKVGKFTKGLNGFWSTVWLYTQFWVSLAMVIITMGLIA